MNSYNPYDFANPVSDASLFAGRPNELTELRYYLDHARNAPKPIHLAFIGERASGKTSLLNMAAVEAEARGFVAARVDLDESDVNSQLPFFYKLFGAVLYGAAKNGAFGGVAGRTYDAFVEIVSSLDVPSDRTFCPFLFPLQYARALKAGRTDTPVLDDLFKQDLALVAQEAERPIVIIVDECDVLTRNRPLLQKLRNIFMNARGYMLVMAGTPQLFPVLDEVFSPIIRQFKRIIVKEFNKRSETRQCILEPLKSVGQPPEQVIDADTITEIHEVASGRPYEIQLICHVLFRRLKAGNTEKMKLSVSALEEVRSELEKSHELTSRPVIAAIRRLSRDRLAALGRLGICSGVATFDQLWAVEYVAKGASDWTRDRLKECLADLIAGNILATAETGIVRFVGDEFDRLYAKYYGEERKVPIRIADIDPELFVYVGLIEALHHVPELVSLPMVMTTEPERSLQDVIGAMSGTELQQLFDDDAPLARELYWPLVQSSEPTATAVTIRLEVVGMKLSAYWLGPDPLRQDGRVNAVLCDHVERVTHLGGTLSIEQDIVSIPTPAALLDAVRNCPDGPFRRQVAEGHLERAIDAYVDDGGPDRQLALRHLDAAMTLDISSENINELNAIGYLHLVANRLDQAEVWFERAIIKAVGEENSLEYPALPLYNVAMCRLLRGDRAGASAKLEEAKEELAAVPESIFPMECLLIASSTTDVAIVAEVRGPDLRLAVAESLDAVDRASPDHAFVLRLVDA